MRANILFAAAALVATEATALVVNAHLRHDHQRLHKRVLHTEYVVHTVWQTVTEYEGEAPTPSPASVFKNVAPTTSSSSIPPTTTPSSTSTPEPEPTVAPQVFVQTEPTSTPTPSPTLEAQSVAPAQAQVAVAEQSSTVASSAPAAAASSSSSSSTSSGNKRGLAYNDASLVTPFVGSGSKCNWAYNWGQTSDGLSAAGVEYVPMLWGPQAIHTSTWTKNADAAVANGAKALLSFNECDNQGQCNTDPASAAAAHIKLMNPYGDKAAISSPAITNSNIAGEGIDWLKAWVSACNGQCKFDFCAAHWYSPADPQNLLSHLDAVHEACQGKPVWLTEFAPIDGDAETFLADVMKELDNNPNYSYVERYSFFFVTTTPHFTSAKMMLSSTSLSPLGQAFAYS